MGLGGSGGDQTRNLFAEQFTPAGTHFIYRKSQKGQAYSVTAEERDCFIAEFDRSLTRSAWIIGGGTMLVIGLMIAASLQWGGDLSRGAMFAAMFAVIIPYMVYFRWIWAAPARQLAGRTPVAGELTAEQVGQLKFSRLQYSQLAMVAFAGLVMAGSAFLRGGPPKGWDLIWPAGGIGLFLLGAVQAFRKWRFEQDNPGTYQAAPAFAPEPALMPKLPAEPGEDQPPNRLLRYFIIGAIGLSAAFLFLTPAGKHFVQEPNFPVVIFIGIGSWALFTVVRSFSTGKIEPFVRGFSSTYEREAQPKRFWASFAWNLLLGGFMLVLGFSMVWTAGAEEAETQCQNRGAKFTPEQAYDACTRLIDGKVKARSLSRADLFDFRAYESRKLGDREQGISDLSRAIAADPKDDYAYLARGEMYIDKAQFDLAIADLTRAHELDPKSLDPIADRGLAYAWKGDRAKAEQDFAAVRARDPKNLVALGGQGVIEMNAGNLEGAVENFTAILRLEPNDPWSLRMRADAYQQMGDFQKAGADRAMLGKLSRSRAQ
ncbi:MAG: tetratricopeptide repeat protein [Pseudomonadota bacterium]